MDENLPNNIIEIGAVHKNAHLVGLENAEKYLLAKIGVGTAENEPDVEV